MFDVMADWLTVPLLNAENGQPPKRMGLAPPRLPLTAYSAQGTAATS
jgi:hypothetical protein